MDFRLKTSASFNVLESHDDNENFAARVRECIIRIYPFARLYKNSVSAGTYLLLYVGVSKLILFWIFV